MSSNSKCGDIYLRSKMVQPPKSYTMRNSKTKKRKIKKINGKDILLEAANTISQGSKAR